MWKTIVGAMSGYRSGKEMVNLKMPWLYGPVKDGVSVSRRMD